MMTWPNRVAGLALGMWILAGSAALGQVVPVPVVPGNAGIGGVYIDAEGTVRYRQTDRQGNVARVRAQGRQGADEQLTFVSLSETLREAQRHVAANEPVPQELRYLGGITQLQYVLVYPEEQDLVIAGPAEEIDASNALQPVGKQTGRPVLQLDDLVVALRRLDRQGRMAPFGCSIDPQGDALAKSQAVMQRHGGRATRRMMEDMAATLGPQVVTFFGSSEQTRGAFICVAADYKLKRLALGLDPSPVGSAVDNSRAAASRFWFETRYEPLLVSEAGDAYEIRGPRLMLKAGAQPFDERGATETGKRFAQQFSQRMGQMAATVPLFADLQNLADLAVLATLIRQDGLDKKVGWDTSWLGEYPVAEMAVPKTAETLVAVRSGSLVAGGVRVDPNSWVAPEARQRDAGERLAKVRAQYEAWRGERR